MADRNFAKAASNFLLEAPPGEYDDCVYMLNHVVQNSAIIVQQKMKHLKNGC